jgi:hypothetical protein
VAWKLAKVILRCDRSVIKSDPKNGAELELKESTGGSAKTDLTLTGYEERINPCCRVRFLDGAVLRAKANGRGCTAEIRRPLARKSA